MKKFILNILQLICVLQQAQLSQQQIQISPEDCQGICTTIAACPPYRNNFAAVFRSIKYCNLGKSIVCCPVKVETRGPDVEEDYSKLRTYERQCIAYNERVYKKCEPQGFIVGGTRAEPHEFPHMALLGAEEEDKTLNWFCGGTLISPNYVLSAAHCFYDTVIPDRVRLGELDYDTDTDDAQPQDFVIKNYVNHPDYDFQRNYNDIVLVELDRDAVLNKYVVPACLPSSNGTDFRYFTAAGWGATRSTDRGISVLQKVVLERFEDSECKEKINLPNALDHGLHTRTQLCAGSRVNQSDTCTGDSGGPLFVRDTKYPCMFQIVGITSFGLGSCGIVGIPAVYVRVSVYLNWIENIVWNVGAK